MDEKVRLVQTYQAAYGLNRCCRVLGLSKGVLWYRAHHPLSNGDSPQETRLRETLEEAIEENPEYGYRRLAAELSDRLDQIQNEKKIQDRLQQWDLGLLREVSRPKASRIQRLIETNKGQLNLVSGWNPEPFEMLSGDFTEFYYRNGSRKAHLVAWLDAAGRWIPGWAVGPSANTSLALRSWRRVRDRFRQVEQPLAGVVVHTDMDSVFKSYHWLREVRYKDGCLISFSENGARHNPWIESLWSHFKGENESLLVEAQTLQEVQEVVHDRMMHYMKNRRHSSLDYVAPLAYLKREKLIPEGLSLN